MATYNVKLITPDGEFNIVPGRHVHPGPGGGGGHRPAVLVPRPGPVGRQLPRRRPDRRRLRAHLRCLPHVRPRYRDSQGGGARRLTVGGGEDGSRMILTAYSPPFLSHHQDSCHDDI
ncbi:hypothetical protein MUK42_36813 [Musa troglodytarum]|uniref:Uncharacterized protein n=1 Tax=Musa troglodytarum TaxID=320322 RepID=A0A9E7HGD0_9LILI|nr:hypothetical protein MUK42_36813 [Musa troglodytarum]